MRGPAIIVATNRSLQLWQIRQHLRFSIPPWLCCLSPVKAIGNHYRPYVRENRSSHDPGPVDATEMGFALPQAELRKDHG